MRNRRAKKGKDVAAQRYAQDHSETGGSPRTTIVEKNVRLSGKRERFTQMAGQPLGQTAWLDCRPKMCCVAAVIVGSRNVDAKHTPPTPQADRILDATAQFLGESKPVWAEWSSTLPDVWSPRSVPNTRIQCRLADCAPHGAGDPLIEYAGDNVLLEEVVFGNH